VLPPTTQFEGGKSPPLSPPWMIFWGPSLLEILSFATSHYAIGMQLVIICNYLGHVYNYKFDIV